MTRFIEILRATIDIAVALCALLILVIPLWFGLAAFGTKWEFWGWQTGLNAMTHVWGLRLLLAGLVAGVLTLVVLILYRLLASQGHGNWLSAIAVSLIAAAGLAWATQIEAGKAAGPAVLDVTTDVLDPPHFSAGFTARRSGLDSSLNYDGKIAADGQALPALQAERYPAIGTLYLDEPTQNAFARALELARELGWRVSTASAEAGMFEAGAESLWFGFRDDIVVRVRPGETGGSLVDIRSVARQPVHDLGRNADRVEAFLEALGGAQS
ncbi:DUF1499 domain-containing protein [Maricaulis salignorans]|uniref:DUF1499 domain-containing protein n=1 Tax=Maricaulis salignorans TaxID=144026 RepID=A0A1G9Q8Z1_9PROT|nr:DUF1499 domain-containing protein [Maricaulis salignorans]SDM07486.1 Protein of unknown function [Maricaulis salignorans]